MIPPVLQKLSQQLSKQVLQLSSDFADGRVNSIQAEQKVIECINSLNYCTTVPEKRSWYDIKIENFYCNIKISEMTGNDNTIGKSVIHYFLTGLDKAPNSYRQCFESMKKNEKPDEQRDYYFIVIRKSDSQCFIISLKNLKVKVAPNNPPFQCNWSENIKQTNRTWAVAKHYFLKQWGRSLIKRQEQQIRIMKKYYPEVSRL